MQSDDDPVDPVDANYADAMERIAEGFLAKTDIVVTGGDRCLMTVHTDMDTLRENGTGARSDLDSGSGVSAEASRRLIYQPCRISGALQLTHEIMPDDFITFFTGGQYLDQATLDGESILVNYEDGYATIQQFKSGQLVLESSLSDCFNTISVDCRSTWF